MYADRYGKTGIKPGSLSVAIGLNGAILAALIFSAPEIITHVDPIFEGRNIPLPDPPPIEPIKKIEPKIEPKLTQPVIERPFIPDTIMPRSADMTELVGTTSLDPGVPEGTATGTGTAPYVPVHIPTLTGATRDSRYANAFQPIYPPAERRAGNEGRVVVRVLIGTDGRVKQVEKVSAASDAFFEVTERQAMNKWRFKPATRDGVPQESWQILSVSFRLDEDG